MFPSHNVFLVMLRRVPEGSAEVCIIDNNVEWPVFLLLFGYQPRSSLPKYNHPSSCRTMDALLDSVFSTSFIA